MKYLEKISRKIIIFLLYVYCKIVYRVKVIGVENIPSKGSLIFCGNHRNYLDPCLIMITIKRETRFLAKDELQKNPFLKFLGKLFDLIFVKRDSKDITAMKESVKTLKSGNCIALFPEGTRNGLEKNDGKIKNGAAYMALKTGANVVPIGIQGPAKPFTRNIIIYGKPLDFSEYSDSKKIEKEIEDNVSDIIKNEIINLTNMNV